MQWEVHHLQYIQFVILIHDQGFTPLEAIQPVPMTRAELGGGLFVAPAYQPSWDCNPIEWWKPEEKLGIIFNWGRTGLLNLCGLVEQWSESGEIVASWQREYQPQVSKS